MKIYLDDIREAPEGWVPAVSVGKFKKIIEKADKNSEKIDAISFDHDLGENTEDGYDAVKWLAENYPRYILENVAIDSHSDNPAGRENIEKFVEFCRNKKEMLLESHREFKIK